MGWEEGGEEDRAIGVEGAKRPPSKGTFTLVVPVR